MAEYVWVEYVTVDYNWQDVDFDFNQYRYRAIAVGRGFTNNVLYKQIGTTTTTGNGNRITGVSKDDYTELTEGMTGPIATEKLTQGVNSLSRGGRDLSSYDDILIERLKLNTEPGQPGPFTSPSASETLRIGATYRFEWGASYDPELNDTIYYKVFTKSSADIGYTTAAIVNTNYWDYTIPEGITSLSLRVYPFNDVTPNELGNVPRDSPEYLVSSGFELYPKVGGVVRETEKAWVKVNGQLREVDGIWIKANYGSKEV